MKFVKSKIIDILTDYLDEKDVRGQRRILEKIVRRLKECRLYQESYEVHGYDIEDLLTQAMGIDTAYNQCAKDYIEKLLIDSDIDDKAIIIGALIDIDILKIEYDYDIEVKINDIGTSMNRSGYKREYLDNAYKNLLSKDYRDCITCLAELLEHMFKVKLHNIGVKKVGNKQLDDASLGMILDVNMNPDIYKVLDKSYEKDIRDIWNDRNKQGAHGTIDYKQLDDKTMRIKFRIVLNIVEDTI